MGPAWRTIGALWVRCTCLTGAAPGSPTPGCRAQAAVGQIRSAALETMAADHNYFSNLIWQIADLLRGPYRPPQYERVMLPFVVLRRFDCVLEKTKAKVVELEGQVKAMEDNLRELQA